MDFHRLLRRFAQRQRALLDRISRAEELADAIACDLVLLERAARRQEPSAVPAPDRSKRQLLRGPFDARVGAIDLKRRADDWIVVRFDQSNEIALPPILGDLPSVLSDDARVSDDELVAWKTLDEVAKDLQRASGRSFSRHAVTQQIYRLRRELFTRGGVSPKLIQTNRRRGVRLALVRKRITDHA
jgi:hypothetical protein